jgi:hypothetical protein
LRQRGAVDGAARLEQLEQGQEAGGGTLHGRSVGRIRAESVLYQT